MGLLEQMRDGYIGKCSTMRLLRYRAPIAHSCSPNESILGAVLGVRDNGVYHLDSGEKGERMGAKGDGRCRFLRQSESQNRVDFPCRVAGKMASPV